MTAMTDLERDTFLLERRLATLSIAREGKGPLLAPIWYRYTPGESMEMCMGGSSAKAHRLRAEGRASLMVFDDGRPYRYVSIEGPVSMTPLGAATKDEIRAMASRYLGERGGNAYAEAFSTPDEVKVVLTPQRWRSEILD